MINKNYKIALYVRVSTDEQAENPEGSIKNQQQRLREAVIYRNKNSSFGEITGVYIDSAISAKDMNRPKLQEMLRAIQNGEINLVMVTELSRLSRNNRDFLSMWDLMREFKCSFMSLREDFDTTTAAGEMLLFQLMNFAQFERKQTSERVTANNLARSARGLYNGGPVPLGYKLMESKPGYLEVDLEFAETVKTAFSAFLKAGSLAQTAKWLNDHGFKMKKHMEGGGMQMRLGHFTVENLQRILRNKSYIGIKSYTQRGEIKESKAVWEGIVDEAIFNQVGKVLAKNRSRLKPLKVGSYPYLLSGLATCLVCKDCMSGKSANGNGGRVYYYEHAWASKREACLSKKFFKCEPHRVSAKKLEALIWIETVKVLSSPQFIQTMIGEVKKIHEEARNNSQSDKIKAKVRGVDSQIGSLVEKLSLIPKSVSPTPIFKQMEKLELHKQELMGRLLMENENPILSDKSLVEIETFESFASYFRKYLSDADQVMKKKIVQKFVKQVEIGEKLVRIHWFLDQHYFKRELALVSSLGSSLLNV